MNPDSDFVKILKARAEALVQTETQLCDKNPKIREFINTAADSGTAKDKAAALVLKLTSGETFVKFCFL